MSNSDFLVQAYRHSMRFLLLILIAVSTAFVSVEAQNESSKNVLPFNDDELWIITDKKPKSKTAILEKRLAVAQLKVQELEKSQRVATRDYADALFDLVEIFDLSERWSDAAQSTKRLISATEKTGGPMPVGICYKRLAYYLFMEGKLDEAIASANTSLELLERKYGQMTPTLLLNLQVLGDIYTRKNDLENAQRIYERMLALTEINKSKQSKEEDVKYMTLNFGKSSVKLADIYRRTGKLEDSERLYRQGLDVVKACIGTQNLFVPKAMYGLSLTLISEKKFSDAQSMLNEALPLAEYGFGPGSAFSEAIKQRIIEVTAATK